MAAGPDRDIASPTSRSRRRGCIAGSVLLAVLLAACDAAGPASRAEAVEAGLPQDIARALQTDERVLDCATGTHAGRSAFRDDWVRVRRVDLDGDGRQDWLLEGRAPCLQGDGVADWWIYAEGDGQRRLIGTQRAVRAVEVLKSRSDGFADLLVVAPDGTHTLRYGDGEYRQTPEDVPESIMEPADAG